MRFLQDQRVTPSLVLVEQGRDWGRIGGYQAGELLALLPNP
ncbi:MAG: hypothetical protein ACK5TQ_18110 [Acetobacteraceae bacterium]